MVQVMSLVRILWAWSLGWLVRLTVGVLGLTVRSPERVTLRTVAPRARNLSTFLRTVTCPLARRQQLRELFGTLLKLTGIGEARLSVPKNLLQCLMSLASLLMLTEGSGLFLARSILKMEMTPKVGIRTLRILAIGPLLPFTIGSFRVLSPRILPPVPNGVGVSTPTVPLFPPIPWRKLLCYPPQFVISRLFRTVTRRAPPKSQSRNPDTAARQVPQCLSLKSLRTLALSWLATLPTCLVSPRLPKRTGAIGRGIPVGVVVLGRIPSLLCRTLGVGQVTIWHLLGIGRFLRMCRYLLLSPIRQLQLAKIFRLAPVTRRLKWGRRTFVPYLLGTLITLEWPRQQLFNRFALAILGKRIQKLIPLGQLTTRLTPRKLSRGSARVVPSLASLAVLSPLNSVVRKPNLLTFVDSITLWGSPTGCVRGS